MMMLKSIRFSLFELPTLLHSVGTYYHSENQFNPDSVLNGPSSIHLN